jgi:hypothetical protein
MLPSFFIGKPLAEIRPAAGHYANLLKNLKQEHSTFYIQVWQQAVRNLMEKTRPAVAGGRGISCKEMVPHFSGDEQPQSTLHHLPGGSHAPLPVWRVRAAVQKPSWLKRTRSSAGLMNVGPHNVFYSLAML